MSSEKTIKIRLEIDIPQDATQGVVLKSSRISPGKPKSIIHQPPPGTATPIRARAVGGGKYVICAHGVAVAAKKVMVFAKIYENGAAPEMEPPDGCLWVRANDAGCWYLPEVAFSSLSGNKVLTVWELDGAFTKSSVTITVTDAGETECEHSGSGSGSGSNPCSGLIDDFARASLADGGGQTNGGPDGASAVEIGPGNVSASGLGAGWFRVSPPGGGEQNVVTVGDDHEVNYPSCGNVRCSLGPSCSITEGSPLAPIYLYFPTGPSSVDVMWH